MKQRLRARVPVGRDADGKPIYRYASGYTKKELEASKQQILAAVAVQAPSLPSSSTLPALLQSVPPAVRPAVQALIGSHAAAPTFGEYASRWYTLYKAPFLRRSTQCTYENVLHHHLYPRFGSMPMDAITADHLQAFLLTFRDSSSSLVDKIMLVIRQVFLAALDDQIILTSPLRKLHPPKGTQKERLPLDLKDVDTITAACLTHPHGLLPLLILYTGLRRGEAVGLQWQDFDGSCITVSRAVYYEDNSRSVVGDTKTKASHRRIPVPLFVSARFGAPCGTYILTGKDTPLAYTTLKRQWANLQRDIPALAGATPHRLRHTYLLLLRRAGVDPATQQYLMGHSDYDTTVNDYTHIDQVDITQAAASLVSVLPAAVPSAAAANAEATKHPAISVPFSPQVIPSLVPSFFCATKNPGIPQCQENQRLGGEIRTLGLLNPISDDTRKAL